MRCLVARNKTKLKKPARPTRKPLTKADVAKALRVKPPLFAPAVEAAVRSLPPGMPEQLQPRGRSAHPSHPLGVNKYEQMDAVLTSKTPDQRRLEEAGDVLKRLMGSDLKLTTVLNAMIGVRRAYVVLYRELNAIVEKARETGEVPEGFEDFAAQYAMYMAAKPFNEHQLMSVDIPRSILPALAAIVDQHTIEEANENLAAREEADRNRLGSLVAVGFKHSPHQEEPALTRDRTLVLVGWRNAVLWLADQAVEHAAKVDHQIVRFMTAAPKVKDQSHAVIRIGGSAWKGCANSDRTFDMCLHGYVAEKLGRPIDLLVVDDLAAAFTSSFLGRPAAAIAGDAQRRFRKWADAHGTAVIGLLPGETKTAADLTAPEYEQLRSFCDLRAVVVETVGDEYELTVGASAAVLRVAKDTLDNYGSATLIVPTLEVG